MNGNPSLMKLLAVIVFFGVLLLILIGIFTGYVTAKPQAQGTPILQDSYPGPGTPVFVSSLTPGTRLSLEEQLILRHKEALKNDNLSEEMRRSLQTKIEILSRVVTQRAMIKETSITRPQITLRVLPTPTSPVGFREGGTSDFHAWEAIIKNRWSQYLNENEYILVYAGELGSEMEYPGRGVVFVSRRFAGRGSSFNRYLLPEGTGWVRISEVSGDYLVLTSKEGATFYFYIPAQQFVTSLRDTAPTVTPFPTRIPTQTPYP